MLCGALAATHRGAPGQISPRATLQRNLVRYTRQELKQDKFKETAAEAVQWSSEHRQKTIVVGVVIVAIAAIAALGFWYYTYSSQQASAALGAAMQINGAPILAKGTAGPQVTSFQTVAERATAAKTAFYEVSSKYGSTRAGKFARYMAGLNEVELGNPKVAEDDFKAIADASDKNVANLAKFALASVYRDTNRESDAIAVYKDLIDHPSDSLPKATAQLELAELYSVKQPDEAKKIYAQIQKDNPKALVGEVAGQHLSSMK
jgi:predicted negative regulator of RcsB-dependent stress response